MTLRKIEFTEESVKLGTQTYYAGDVKSFAKEEADEYIRLGWAKDVETGETGERKPGATKLNIDSVTVTI